MSQLEETLAFHLRAAKITGWEREVAVIPGRRFKWDFVFAQERLLIECQGGTWGKAGKGGPSAHSGGVAANRDAEKLNLATLAGWRTLQVTTNHVRSGEALAWIQQALKQSV